MASDESRTNAELIKELQLLRQQFEALKDELARVKSTSSGIPTQEDDLQHHQAETQLKQQLIENQMLMQISQVLTSSLEATTILQRIADAAANMIERADRVVIHLVDENETFLTAVAVSGAEQPLGPQRLNFTYGEGIAGLVLATGKPIYLPDAPKDPRYVPTENIEKRVRSLLVAPIWSDSKNLGTISVHSKQPDVFTGNDERLLVLLGTQAALALSKTQMFDATQRRLKEVNTLYKITQRITETFDIDVLLLQVVTLLQEYFTFYHVHIYLIDQVSGDLVMRQGSGEVGIRLKNMDHRLKAGTGIAGYVACTGQPFITNNVNEVPFYVRNPLLPDTSGELAAPLKVGDRIFGVIDLQNKSPQLFNDNEINMMTVIANQVAVAIERFGIHSDLQTALVHEQNTRVQLVQSEKLAALGRIVASVAHELNNPLQAIQNALYLIKMSDSLDPQSREDLQVALNEASRMADLISRLRETYRPTVGEEFHYDSLNSVIEEVQKLISTHLRHHNILYKFEPEPNLPLIPIIRDQIKQVILNICLNAVEAMENGGTLTLKTDLDDGKDRARLAISDTGPGIPPAILPYIFDPFVTTKSRGTGLGLAITYDIIRRHNGQVDVDSKVGEGSTFTVLFPLIQ